MRRKRWKCHIRRGSTNFLWNHSLKNESTGCRAKAAATFFKNRAKLKSVEELQGEEEIDNFCEMEKKTICEFGKKEESHQQEVNQLGLKTHVKELYLNSDERCKGNKATTFKPENYTTPVFEPDGAKEWCGIYKLTIH